jgi:hypothetical protein
METSNAEITTLAELGAADAKPNEAKDGDSATPAAVDSTSEDTSSWTEKAQKRYDELTRKTYEALGERDRERYQREASEARAKAAEDRLAALEKAKTSEVAPQETFPTLESVGYDEGKFYAAVAAFTRGSTEAAKVAAREAAQEIIQAERDAQSKEQTNRTWKAKEAEFLKSKPDYAQKVYRDPRDGGPIVTQTMGEVMLASDLGPAIAYYLSENVESAAKIAGLPPLEQAREIGRIEAKLEAAKVPPRPAVSQAPPPVAKVEAGEGSLSGISTTDPQSDNLSDDAWVKAENARLARKFKRQGG